MGIPDMLLIVDFILPIVMISAGYHLYKKPPQIRITFMGVDRDLLRGILEYWHSSQSLPGKLWLRHGILMFCLSDIVYVITERISLMTLEIASGTLIVVQILTILYTFYDVSKRLCKKFESCKKEQ